METGSESLSWQEWEIGTCFSLFWNKYTHLPVAQCAYRGQDNVINWFEVQRGFLVTFFCKMQDGI